jgi:hypothetical protein
LEFDRLFIEKILNYKNVNVAKLFPITSTFSLVTKHSHLCENQKCPFSSTQKMVMNFHPNIKGYKNIGPMGAQGGTLF